MRTDSKEIRKMELGDIAPAENKWKNSNRLEQEQVTAPVEVYKHSAGLSRRAAACKRGEQRCNTTNRKSSHLMHALRS